MGTTRQSRWARRRTKRCVLVIVNVPEFSCQANFKSICHGRGQDPTYKHGHGYAGTSSALFPIPLLIYCSPSSATSATTYTCSTASDEYLSQNLGKQIIPERLLACEGDNSHNMAAQLDLEEQRGRHRCVRMSIVMQVRLSPMHLII